MKKNGFFFVLYLLTSVALASEDKQQENYYIQLHTGQHQTENYQGPLNPQTQFKGEAGHLVFLDDIYSDNFFHNELE